jgi:hypothetical protein
LLSSLLRHQPLSFSTHVHTNWSTPHTSPPFQKTISFTLDKTKPNLVMRQADGFWHVQAPADRYELHYFSSHLRTSLDSSLSYLLALTAAHPILAHRPDGYTRVYLSANIIASRVVPTILGKSTVSSVSPVFYILDLLLSQSDFIFSPSSSAVTRINRPKRVHCTTHVIAN